MSYVAFFGLAILVVGLGSVIIVVIGAWAAEKSPHRESGGATDAFDTATWINHSCATAALGALMLVIDAIW